MRLPSRLLQVTEYETLALPADALSEAAGTTLARVYGSQIQVEPPSFLNDQHWRLTARGWVGLIPLMPELGILLRPRVPVGNVFAMLAYADGLTSFRFLDGLMASDSMVGFYERLADALAQRVLARARRGFHRAYDLRRDDLPYLTGRLVTERLASRPGQVRLPCRYETHATDIPDNQILAWTLHRMLQTGVFREPTDLNVRRAYRAVRSFASIRPVDAAACVGRTYTRLNEDYRAMHALCRFFLSHQGPSHVIGEHAVLPFLVDMPHLYERFVAEWLRLHLPPTLRLARQEPVSFGPQPLRFDIDLTLYDSTTRQVRCVLDTKYKLPDHAAHGDIAQVVAYAEAIGCRTAVLVYPVPLPRPLDVIVGDIHVTTMTFATEGDLEASGARFLRDLEAMIPAMAAAGGMGKSHLSPSNPV